MANLYVRKIGLPALPRNRMMRETNVNTGIVSVIDLSSPAPIAPPTETSFISLTDTPDSYVGSENYFVRVAPTGDGLVFTSSTGENPTFIGLGDTPASYENQAGKGTRVNTSEDGIEFYTIVSVHNQLSGRDEASCHSIAAITDLQDALDSKAGIGDSFLKSEHIDEYEGSGSVGLPIIVNESGYVDATLLETKLLNFKGGFYPVSGDCASEYPAVDEAVNVAGDFWLMLEPTDWDDTNPGEIWYLNFSCGSLYKPDDPNPNPPPNEIPKGLVFNGDAIIYTGEFIDDDGFGNRVPKFVRYRMKLNPGIYYWRDGQYPLTADFEAGGHKLTNVADGTEDTDAITLGQADDRFMNVSGDIMRGNVTIEKSVPSIILKDTGDQVRWDILSDNSNLLVQERNYDTGAYERIVLNINKNAPTLKGSPTTGWTITDSPIWYGGNAPHADIPRTDAGADNFLAGDGTYKAVGDTVPTWTELTLTTNWLHANLSEIGYYIDTLGIVHLTGAVSAKIDIGSGGDAVYTLPAEAFPPTVTTVFTQGGPGEPYGILGTDGVLTIFNATANDMFTLEGFTYNPNIIYP